MTRHPLRLALPLVLTIGGLAGLPGAAYAVDPVDGAQTSGDAMFPNVGNGGYDAQHYDVDLAWSPTGLVGGITPGVLDSATTTMTATTTGAPLQTFSLDLEGLTVDAVTVNGAAADWTRDVDESATKFKLVVEPVEPVSGEFATVVTYHGVPDHHVDADGSWEGWTDTSDGVIFMGQPIGAMTAIPHNNTPADKATWTFSTDVPTGLEVVGNGELAPPTVDGARTTWTWDQTEPMASELTLISIGQYDVTESEVTLSGGRTVPEWSFVDSALSPQDKADFAEQRAAAAAALPRLEQLFGPYPGNSVGLVVDTVPAGINYALETQDRPFFPSVTDLGGSLVHELTHQWYGDSVSPTVWTDIWINEGMASWAPSYDADPTTVEAEIYGSWAGVGSANPAWATAPGAQTDPGNLYGFQTYTRGAMFWEALRSAIRDPDFFAVVKQWQSRYAGQSRSGADLLALAEEISGVDLTAFYQDWILDEDKPAWPAKYDVTLASTPAPGAVTPGTALTYTLSTANVGLVEMAGQVVRVDVADLLDDATLGALPAGLTLTGTTLSWAVPSTAVDGAASTTFGAVVGTRSGGTVAAKVLPGLGAACTACGSSYSVSPPPLGTLAPGTVRIAGKAQVGRTLYARPRGFDTGSAAAFRWYVGSRLVGSKPSLRLTKALTGKRIVLGVTVTKAGYQPVTVSSAPTAKVKKAKKHRKHRK